MRVPPILAAGCVRSIVCRLMGQHMLTGLLGVMVMGGVATGGPVSGVVRTETRPGVVPASAVVYAEPIDTAAPRRPGSFALTQRQKSFQPHLLAVPVGSTVTFPNEDRIFHNVFSLSVPQPFDLGLYRAGQARTRTFTQPGTYRVFCNIHPQMSALVLVVPTPHVVATGADGRYQFDLPAGRWRVTAVSERAEPVSVLIEVPVGVSEAPALTLDETRWVTVQHKNKYGKDYAKEAYSR
jgi:plastocyanin